jgi:diguanylate cyclase (GGDEF)-like protein
MKNILVVDDDNLNRITVSHALSDQYHVETTSTGAKAIQYLDSNEVDLILMDIEMPGMNGIETTKLIKANNKWANIPIIILTADSDPVTESECLKLGADDFLIKPVVPLVMNERISRILELYDLRNDLEAKLEQKTKEIETVTTNAIISIANTIDAKDKYTSGHSIRVAKCSAEIGRRLGWGEAEIQNLKVVALLHDIGKIGVPDSVLNKPGRLTDAEFAVIKKHPLTGGEILKDIKTIKHVREGAMFHHERFDGNGYPFGLRGVDIPIYARIIGIADSYDAMTTNRVYREKLSKEHVISEFEKGKGTQFDPNLADLMIQMIKEDFKYSPDDNINKGISYYSDIADEYSADSKNNSINDSLTGLYNRSYAETLISEIMSSGHKGSLFIFDLDNFRLLNDTYGHITGDKILKIFADILRDNVSDKDIVCRLSGDRFLVFYQELIDPSAIADKVKLVSNTYHTSVKLLSDHEKFTVSTGISIHSDDEKDFTTLFNNADKALYYVKNNDVDKEDKNDKSDRYHIFRKEKHIENDAHNTSADLKNLKRILETGFVDSDSFMNVAYDEFQNIYDFISRYVKRSHQAVETILFTLIARDQNKYPDIPSLENAMNGLRTAVVASLRASDVGTKFSSNQYIVLLMDADLTNGNMVAKRVIAKFEGIYHGDDITVKYDIEAIDPNADEGLQEEIVSSVGE